jgi:dynein heavy chain
MNNEQFLKHLKARDREQSRYLQALLPTHPDEQKLKIISQFHERFERASLQFSEVVRQRMLNLFDEISVNQVEIYPSKYFKKIIPRIDDRKPLWQRAHKFIAEEERLWPEIKSEVMLMDFLFNPENKVRRETAVMIISLLMDLQEDYRYCIKRALVRFILNSDAERKRLQIEPEPPEFPIATIKAPVPWKCSVQVAKNRLEEVLMVNHPLLQAIQMLWHNLYHDLLIVDTGKFYKCEIPYHAENITEIINSCCKITRDVSVKGEKENFMWWWLRQMGLSATMFGFTLKSPNLSAPIRPSLSLSSNSRE